jgi:hypothetical protein
MEAAEKFTKKFEIKLSKNIDRIIPIDDKGKYLVATYHLDKETQTKSGSIQSV